MKVRKRNNPNCYRRSIDRIEAEYGNKPTGRWSKNGVPSLPPQNPEKLQFTGIRKKRRLRND